MQVSALSSGIQIAGTQCSTQPLLSFSPLTLTFLPFSPLVSSGANGNACNESRIWLLLSELVSVELGFVIFSDMSSCAFACRIVEHHSSLSSSESANNTKLPPGLKTSNRLSSPSSRGGVTTTSRSTRPARPLYVHLSSPAFALLACLFSPPVGALFREGGMTLLLFTGPAGLDIAKFGISASLLLRVRIIIGRLKTWSCCCGLFPQPPMLIQLRSDSSLANQMRLSEKRRNSRSR